MQEHNTREFRNSGVMLLLSKNNVTLKTSKTERNTKAILTWGIHPHPLGPKLCGEVRGDRLERFNFHLPLRLHVGFAQNDENFLDNPGNMRFIAVIIYKHLLIWTSNFEAHTLEELKYSFHNPPS